MAEATLATARMQAKMIGCCIVEVAQVFDMLLER